MKDFYEKFYSLAPDSPAHVEFCERVFGKNLCQHGFADMEQIDRLVDALALQRGQYVLEIGCGNGMIAEDISDRTGASITGIDTCDIAIEQAARRTAGKADRLRFVTGDINALDLPEHTYDAAFLIDSIYFSNDYTRTIGALASALRPGGQLAIFYSYGREPWVAREDFPVHHLAPDQTPLAEALKRNGLGYQVDDFTDSDYRLAFRRAETLIRLRDAFEREHLTFVWENRMGDAKGVRQAIEDGLHRRYLYHARLCE